MTTLNMTKPLINKNGFKDANRNKISRNRNQPLLKAAKLNSNFNTSEIVGRKYQKKYDDVDSDFSLKTYRIHCTEGGYINEDANN